MKLSIFIASLMVAGIAAAGPAHKNDLYNGEIQWNGVKEVTTLEPLPTTTGGTTTSSAPMPDAVGQVLREKPQAIDSGSTSGKKSTTGTTTVAGLTSPGGTPGTNQKMDGETNGQDPLTIPKQKNLQFLQLGMQA